MLLGSLPNLPGLIVTCCLQIRCFTKPIQWIVVLMRIREMPKKILSVLKKQHFIIVNNDIPNNLFKLIY